MTSTPVTTGRAVEERPPGLLLLMVLCGAHLMDAIDLSDVTVALPAVQSDLGMGAGALGWVVSAYLLGYGGFLLLGGRAADVLGRRRVFLVSVAVFGVFSVLAALAPTGDVLIVARLVKGIAAGFLAPAALSLITSLWPDGEARGRALGAYATSGAAGFVGGLVLGGLATQVSWRLAFALPIPIAVAVLALAPRLIPKDHPRDRTPLDAAGAALAAGAVGVLVVALTQGPTWGWADPRFAGLLLGAAGLLCGFVLRERATAHPLLPLDFLARRPTASSSIVIALLWAAYTGFAFLTTLALADSLDYSPLQTGLAFVPIGVVNGLLATSTGRLAARVGARPLVLTGMVLLTVSYALVLRLEPGAGFLSVVAPVMVVNGLGLALSFAPLNVAALSGVPEHRQGLAAALLGTSQQLGGAVGLALVTAVVAAGATPSDDQAAVAVVVALSAAGAAAAVLLRPAAATPTQQPAHAARTTGTSR